MTVAVERGMVQFGPFRVDLKTQRLYRDQIWIKLPRQSFLILKMLLARPGEVVTREELRVALWPSDTFVDFDHGLNNAINRLRTVLNDRTDSPAYIETLPKVGYRFLGSVQVTGNGTASEAPSNTESATASLTPEPALIAPRLWKSKGLLVWLVILALAILGTWWLKDGFRRPDPEIHSIAVLPLQNLSGDPSQEYFADGTTEELISALARLSDLRVTSRTSAMQFKRVQKSAKEIGRLLDVDAIVEGSVARYGDTVRITAQLIDAHADKHLWAGEYHSSLSDVLRQQEEIAHDIALNVSAKIAPQDDRQLAAAKAIDPQAHDLYLRARQHAAEWDQTGMLRAIELYQRAIELQPDYAAAYVGLADAHSIFAIQDTESEWPHVREAASKALSLDSSVTGAHAQLAQVKHIYDWDTAGAEEEFQKALKTDRDGAETHMKYALFLAQIGRVAEGLAEAQFAEELDPLSSRISATKEKIFIIARRYDDVFKQAKRTRELYPDSYVTALHVLETYQLLGRYQESIDEEEAHPEPGGWTQHEAAIFADKLRSALRSQGPKGYWSALLQYRLDTQADDHCLLAYVYFRTGDHENGYRQLELAIKGRDRNLRQMKTHPMWDFVRDDPRFQDVLRRVGY